MSLTNKLAKLRIPWFWLGIACLSGFSTVLHFWGLNRFNNLVWDETFYAQYSHNYLTQTPFFDLHPPLGKYFIAIGIWLNAHNSSLAIPTLNAFSYRWMNAWIGSWIPLIVAGIAYQLNRCRIYTFAAGLFAAVDGLLLVESRYALINIYLIFFGLLGQWLFLLGLNTRNTRSSLLFLASGICLGASINVKWNGLGFLLSIYILWLGVWGLHGWQAWQANTTRRLADREVSQTASQIHRQAPTLFQKLLRLRFHKLLLHFGIVPGVTYALLWMPHLLLYPDSGFWSIHRQILAAHQQTGSGTAVHPYCTPWYAWPLMLRPQGYIFSAVQQPEATTSSGLAEPVQTIYYDVHGMGNPVLWWLAAIAIALAVGILARHIWVRPTLNPTNLSVAQNAEIWALLYLAINYAANWLPWSIVSRCTFLYHYMAASVFAFLTLAWFVARGLRENNPFLQFLGVAIPACVLLAFAFWLPLYLGLPLSPEGFQMRIWLRSWI